METTPYFNAITDARALAVDEEDWLEGKTLMSAETAGVGEDHLAIFIKENFGTFLTYLKYLPAGDRDLVLSIFCLGSAQNQMAYLLEHTQTVCSQRWRMASLKLGYYAMQQGHPTQEAMEATLTGAGQDAAVAQYVALYRERGSFTDVAKELKLHRPVIKRGISAASKALLQSENRAEAGLGAYLHDVVGDKDPTGTGKSKAAKRRSTRLTLHDPDACGQFRIKIDDPGFDKLFMAKSSMFHHSDE